MSSYRFDLSKDKKKMKDKIQKGWHEVFAWTPKRTINRKLVWFQKVEKKYYGKTGRGVVKKDLNLDQLYAVYQLDVMYRIPGQKGEKRIYSNGSRIFRDTAELLKNKNLLKKVSELVK